MAAPSAPMLPRLRHIDPDVQRWADALVNALSVELASLRTAQGQTAYTLTSVTPSRSLTPTTATTAQTAQVLGTVIQDLQKKGALA